MNKGLFCFVALVFLCCISSVRSQNDSMANIAQDAILQKSQNQGSKLLKESDSSNVADSLVQQKLLDEIEGLKSGERSKKLALQVKLDSIKLSITEKNERIKHQVDSLRSNTLGFPVVFANDTLFRIYAKLGPFSPSERAAAIEKKVKTIALDFDASKLISVNGEESSDLFYDEIIVLSISSRDAFWANKEKHELVEIYRAKIIDSIALYLDETSLMTLIFRISMILLVIVILIIMIRVLNRAFSKIVTYAMKKGKVYLNGIKIKNYEVLTYEREMQVVVFLLNTGKWLTILFILYSSLPVIFSIFPATESIATKLIHYALDPFLSIFMAIIGYIPEIITIAVIVVVTRYFIAFLRFLAKEIESEKLKIPGFYSDWSKPTFNLIAFIIRAFAFVVIFPYLPGSDSPVFQGVSVFLGLLISLGSSSAIGNMVAGLVITYMRPFKLGDRVKIGESMGEVIEKTMLVTRLRTIKNEDVTIPNAAILNGQTINYSSSAEKLGLIVHSSITIGYDVDWKKVNECLIESALKTSTILKDPPPFVLQTSLDDFYVSYQINGYTKQVDKIARTYSELHATILDVFHAAGIEIMSPHFQAERDGNTTQIPSKTK